MIAKIFVLAVSVLILLPQVYIGLKGLKMAKEPDSSIGHIVWGVIVTAFTAMGLISAFVAFVQGNGVAFANVAQFLSIAVDVAILVGYVKLAIAVRKEA